MRFSVVIPVYNVKEYLEKCVDSVLAQDTADYEMILVDDGSTDGSGALCDTIAARRPECIRVIHKPNGGLGDARNVGLAHAQGDYLVFLDSDDYIASTMLSELSEQIDRFQPEIITFGFRYDENGTISEPVLEDLPSERVFSAKELPRCLIGTPSACLRIYARKLFLDTGVRYPSRVWYEDLRTTWKLYVQAERILCVPKAYYYYVQRDNSIMHHPNLERNREIIDAMEDLLQYFKKNEMYETYRDELCWLTISNVFWYAAVRVLKVDSKHPLLREFRSYIDQKFPDFRNNPYLADMPKERKLTYQLLLHRQYGLLAKLFRMKSRWT